MYPANWPRCPNCGDFAVDGHITCGRLECNEGSARRAQSREQYLCTLCHTNTVDAASGCDTCAACLARR